MDVRPRSLVWSGRHQAVHLAFIRGMGCSVIFRKTINERQKTKARRPEVGLG